MLTYAKIGVLTVSDRASRGEYEDLGGPAICEYLLRGSGSRHGRRNASVVSDDRQLIAGELQRMADDLKCCLIITTGGTGPAVRDVTPEATRRCMSEADAGLWRTYEERIIAESSHRHPEPPDRRNSRLKPNRQFTRAAKSHPRMSRRRNAGHSLLY